jgi:hypothetical protein
MSEEIQIKSKKINMKNIYVFDKETLNSVPVKDYLFDIDTDQLKTRSNSKQIELCKLCNRDINTWLCSLCDTHDCNNNCACFD